MVSDISIIDKKISAVRRKTSTINIGDLKIGSDFPIRIQSMTNTDTMNTIASVEQIIRMVDAGCELVRLTAQSLNEAQNLESIKKELDKRGYKIPLVADIHFTPNAAELAARIVEKVRINPGNFADKKRFDIIDYTNIQYNEELDRIYKKFIPLLKICKEYGTALRIGTNHGSLSDRIMSRYGDTAHGMVESAMEFLRMCELEGFSNIVLSMKSSNPIVMIHSYRLLVEKMQNEKMFYPLHLGVTEAGDGDDGRIKSALGIGALLEDGLGDTIRVSLTEEPEFEVPVAKKLVSRYKNIKVDGKYINEPIKLFGSGNFEYARRKSDAILNFGETNVPRVIANLSKQEEINSDTLKSIGYFYNKLTDKWHLTDQAADYIYFGNNIPKLELPLSVKAILNYEVWKLQNQKQNIIPLFNKNNFLSILKNQDVTSFLHIDCLDLDENVLDLLKANKNTILILSSRNDSAFINLRNMFDLFDQRKITTPVVLSSNYKINEEEETILHASTDCGALFASGFGDGIMLSSTFLNFGRLNQIAFGILQAARTRISKTEYISCPSCGRTLFNLQETTSEIKNKTSHLKGIKIAIMGCIVNGPGEMADADYGYVGSGIGKITLYKGRDVIKKSVSSESAVNELIELIRENGDWVEND